MDFMSKKYREKYKSLDHHLKSTTIPKQPIKKAIVEEPTQPSIAAVIITDPPSKPPIEQLYNPFPLLPNSSFNPSSISEKRLAHLHPIIKAKYAAYCRPNADVEYEINKTELRSKAYLAEKQAAEKKKKEDFQKKYDVLHRNQDPESIALGLELSAQSQKRIKARKQKNLNDQTAELLLIVEGQKNSIEAIKVIQYLMPREKATKVEQLELKDRQRVEALLRA